MSIFNYLKNLLSGILNSNDEQPKSGWSEKDGVYYAKGSFDNEVEYNNEVICIINQCDYDMACMNEAMEAKDYHEAEQVRLAWKENLKEYAEELKELGDYYGDDSLLKAAFRSLDFYNELMDDGYQKLIRLRLEGKYGTAEERAQLQKNNDAIVNNSNRFNEVSDEFIERHQDDE